MKIYYDIDVDDHTIEGRASIAGKIKQFLIKKGYKFTNNIQEADLIHIHNSGIFKSHQAYKLKNKYDIPCIYSLYSNSKTDIFNHIRNFITRYIIFGKSSTSFLLSYTAIIPLKIRGIFLKKLDTIVVPSNYLKKTLFKNTKVIRLGIDLKKYYPLKKKTESKKIKVAYFGHASVFKGLNDFIQASKSFSKDTETYIFVTKLDKKVKDYIKKQNPKIRLFGYIKNINKTYNEMDIIVLPYRNELGAVANPLVLLEAMATKKAIITTNLKFLKEIVKDSSILIRPYSPKSITKAVNLLSKDKELREKLGKKAKKIVEKDYDQEDMFKSYQELYEKLLK